MTMKINIERMRPSIEGIPMAYVAPPALAGPTPEVRPRSVDWLALTSEEQKAITDWLEDAEFILPARAAVFVRRHFNAVTP